MVSALIPFIKALTLISMLLFSLSLSVTCSFSPFKYNFCDNKSDILNSSLFLMYPLKLCKSSLFAIKKYSSSVFMLLLSSMLITFSVT